MTERSGRISSRYAGITAFALLLTLAVLFPAAAGAINTRVSIAYYKWSNAEVHVDLGEKVTWDWLGPDLAHSVTGISADSRQWDSDPRTDAPFHRAGYSYTIQFNEPGTYTFQCKLHPVVRGSVIVSNVPGDPNSDPGPQPPLNIDVTPPKLGPLKLGKHRAQAGAGVPLSANVSEKGHLEAQYYLLKRGKRAYAGFARWNTKAGLNHLKLGARWKHFPAQPGRYEAVLRASDGSANQSRPAKLRFTISG
jgi:plastocyanin